VLGWAQAILNYDLGTGEAISGTIVIGLSIDYTVHLGHTYTDSLAKYREGRMTFAATMMGGTVLGGGATTLGCALFMLPCQLTFFSKMANLLAATICFSLIFSFGFFLPLMSVIGPEGRPRSIFARIAGFGGGGGSSEPTCTTNTQPPPDGQKKIPGVTV